MSEEQTDFIFKYSLDEKPTITFNISPKLMERFEKEGILEKQDGINHPAYDGLPIVLSWFANMLMKKVVISKQCILKDLADTSLNYTETKSRIFNRNNKLITKH